MQPLFLRSRALRIYLDLGVGGLFVGAMALASLLHYRNLSLVETEAAAKIRVLSRGRAQMALSQSLLTGEAGLRSFVATSDQQFLSAYKDALRTEGEAWRNLMDNLGPGDDEAARLLIMRLENRVKAWHQDVAAPMVTGRVVLRPGQVANFLKVERERFEEIQVASEALVRFLDQRDERRILDVESQRQSALWQSLVGVGFMMLAMVVLTRWLLWRIARPLTSLAARAWEGRGFEEPEPHPVREIDILRRALYDLFQRVLDREQALLRERDEMRELQAFGDLVQHVRSEAELMEALEQAMRRLVGAERVQVFLKALQGDGLVQGNGELVPGDHPVLQDASVCRAIRLGGTVGLPARSATACICTLGVPKQGAYLCQPLVAAGQILGLVNLQADHPSHWTAERKQLISACVSLAAAGFQTLRALGVAREQAVRDPLTGTFNRRFLNEFLTKLLPQAKRKRRPLSLLLFDIDHFKRVNDTYGHDVGDRVLMTFAQFLRDRVRQGDAVARYGGEEFVVALPDTDHREALQLAERIRQGAQQLAVLVGSVDEPVCITASVGVATFPQHGELVEVVLGAADKALYVAKGSGRNRTVSAEELA